MAKAISSTTSDATKKRIIDMLVAASFGLHAGGSKVIEFAKAVLGNSAVDTSVAEREEDEKMVGMNGKSGEGGACTSLARAYALLLDNGEAENAEELQTLALRRFLREQFTAELDKVRSGW